MNGLVGTIRGWFRSAPNPLFLARADFGAWAEGQAARFVKKKGMKILARNYRVGPGELDIVARDHEWVVFMEVKAVRDPEGEPELKVNREKRRRMIAAAKHFLGRMRPEDPPARFDIVTVRCDQAGQTVIEHEEDAFQA